MKQEMNPIVNVFLWILRIAVGGLFIFSGIVKANDPKGLAYKMGEFFEAWAVKDNFLPDLMHWLNQYTLEFAIVMIVLEIVAGIALILGYKFSFFSWLIFLLTTFFTFLTTYVLFSGNIKACGCFGDCIPLTPNGTFTKDIILLILISILLFYRNKITALFSTRIGTLVMIVGLGIAIYLNLDVLKNLPYIDCLPYKVGNNISKEMERPEDYQDATIENKLIYENVKTGIKKGFTDLNEAPWKDTINWKYVENIQTELSPAKNLPKILDFGIFGRSSEDLTTQILDYEQNIIILFVKDASTVKLNNSANLRKLIQKANEANTPFFALSPSSEEEIGQFKAKHNIDLNFYVIDGVVCKTAMRSNPGIMLINKGTILGKWSPNNFNKVSKLITTQEKNPLFTKPAKETTYSDSSLNNE